MIGENRMTRRGWAIVTGASGGRGAAFTKALAKRGYSVLAVARGVEPLARMADELKKDGAFVETLAVDLATAEGLKAVVERAHALGDIELLVNSAGLSTSGDFLDQSADKEIQSIRVNVEALYTLTRLMSAPEWNPLRRGGWKWASPPAVHQRGCGNAPRPCEAPQYQPRRAHRGRRWPAPPGSL
jgi:NAD(P)-dependent dehydrogenase (short-subunit alcohol dehydrogenase family)